MGLDGFEYLKKQDIKEQVFQQLLSKIQSGEWKPGEKLPSENELTKAMGVSRITDRKLSRSWWRSIWWKHIRARALL